MRFIDKVKKWFNKYKKYVLLGGSVVLVVGTGIVYVICKKVKFHLMIG